MLTKKENWVNYSCVNMCWSTKNTRICVCVFFFWFVGFVVHHYPQSAMCLPSTLYLNKKKNTESHFFLRTTFRSSGQIAKDLASVITISTTLHLSMGLANGCSICFFLLSLVYAAVSNQLRLRLQEERRWYWKSRVSRNFAEAGEKLALVAKANGMH